VILVYSDGGWFLKKSLIRKIARTIAKNDAKTEGIMKNKVVQICSLVLLLAGLTISAPAQTPEYRASIPFDFNIGNKTLPAGDYIVALADFIDSRNVLTIREAKSEKSQIVMFSPKSSKKPVELSELAFNRYDKQYFLAEIISPTIYGAFSRTTAETRLAETQTPVRETVAITKQAGN
jgi:hypothetical protein